MAAPEKGEQIIKGDRVKLADNHEHNVAETVKDLWGKNEKHSPQELAEFSKKMAELDHKMHEQKLISNPNLHVVGFEKNGNLILAEYPAGKQHGDHNKQDVHAKNMYVVNAHGEVVGKAECDKNGKPQHWDRLPAQAAGKVENMTADGLPQKISDGHGHEWNVKYNGKQVQEAVLVEQANDPKYPAGSKIVMDYTRGTDPNHPEQMTATYAIYGPKGDVIQQPKDAGGRYNVSVAPDGTVTVTDIIEDNNIPHRVATWSPNGQYHEEQRTGA